MFSIDRITYLALEGGPPGFRQGFTCPVLLDNIDDKVASLCVPDYHCLWCSFPTASAYNAISYFMLGMVALASLCRLPAKTGRPQKGIYMSQPLYKHSSTNLFKLCSLKVYKVWAVADSLATTTAIVVYFLFLALLRCFSSGGYLLPILCVQIGVTRHDSSRVSPFGHLRINTYLAGPRSFSQLIATVLGVIRQGILCARLSNFLRRSEINLRTVH